MASDVFFLLGLSDIPLLDLQIRRQTRERRQYIYAKSLEAQERQTFERKQKVKVS